MVETALRAFEVFMSFTFLLAFPFCVAYSVVFGITEEARATAWDRDTARRGLPLFRF